MCQKTRWIHIRTEIVLVPTWVQSDCKSCQQTTKVATGKVIVRIIKQVNMGQSGTIGESNQSSSVRKAHYA